MAFGIQQTRQARSWTQILVEESEYSLKMREAKRRQTFRRLYMSVFTLFLASGLLYCSMFYLSSFVDVGKTIGLSSYSERAQLARRNVAQLQPQSKRTLLSPFVDMFSMNRVYLRPGQSILATYSLPPDTVSQLYIRQCKRAPVLEVFSCEFSNIQTTTIADKTNGYVKFTITEAGFYYFDAKVIKRPKTELKKHHDYKIVWRRS